MAKEIKGASPGFTWELDGELVTVSHPQYGKKTTQQGNSRPEVVAKMLEMELLREKGRR